MPTRMRNNNAATAPWRASGNVSDHSRGQGSTLRLQPLTPHGPPLVLRQRADWQKCPEISIRISHLPPSFTTWDLFRNFKRYGTVVFVELYEKYGAKDGSGKIRFSPPPSEAFWTHQPMGLYRVMSEDGRSWNVYVKLDEKQMLRQFKIQSPIRKSVSYDAKMKLYPSALHFGLMLDQKSMMRMQTVQDDTRDDMSFVVDLLKNRVVATFMVHFKDPRAEVATESRSASTVSRFERKNRYMFQIPFGQLKTVHRVNIDAETLAILISLESPPQFFRKREDEKTCHSNENLVWSEFDSWYRQTDIVYNPYALSTATVALHKERPVIDIGESYSVQTSLMLTSAGRWTTYQFIFNINQNDRNVYDMIQQALQDFNIEIVTLNEFHNLPACPAELWSLIDPPSSLHASAELRYLEGSESAMYLPFEVRYELEVCISREILNEHNITKSFVATLAEIASKDPNKARTILEYVAERRKRIYEPMTIFEDKEALAFSPKTEIPHYCAFSRKATITPSTIYFSSPTVETTNRVLRHYSRENKDGRFLRVQFTDEIFEGRINSCADKQRNDELFTRVYRTLFNGIQIGDRHYHFLAFGNSQFRENGAYFFCPTDHLSCDDIRRWMGNFSHIGVVAKYAARLGQCFSTTRAIKGLSKPDIVKIPDIERDGYCFTDGVGKLSPFLAQMITAELGLRVNLPPSAFQFRLGGCKGILVVWPDARDKEVHIRMSQEKFAATYNGLEIIRWSRFSAATLNRQTITILSALGVPDKVFLRMLTEQLFNYQAAMSNNTLALSLLSRYIDDNQMTLNIASMILNGFMTDREPFVMSLLHLWRAWSIKLLKEKAKIIVENGAFVLGCVDETGALRGYSKPTVAPGEPFTEEELPQIFIQVPEKKDPSDKNPSYNVIEGICLVGRNPSLHPGDLRVVQAVDVPALHHIRDLVVFPQTGERDVPSMCSGGDLDGDDFFVIWDRELQPPEWNCEPMSYDPPEPRKSRHPVQVTDLMKFFVRFMKNDALPTIAHAHMANSDYLELGVKDDKCLQLAALHSKAVDYVKTGQPAEMPKHLRPSKWPHFMEKKFKPKDAVYHSHKILGQLYDRVQSVDFIPQWEEPFDKRILRAYKLDDALLKTARQMKTQYDNYMKRIMALHQIKTEFEVWSTFVLSKPVVGSDYKRQEEMATVSGDLKERFRLTCIEAAGSNDFAVLGPFVAGMYKVTKEELDIALAECHSTKLVGGREMPRRKMEPEFMPLISFPWLFEKELGRIATGIDASDDLDGLNLRPLEIGVKTDVSHARKRQSHGPVNIDTDFIQQEDGVVVHRGEELELFRRVDDSEDLSDDSDFEEAPRFRDEHPYTMGPSGEVILATDFRFPKGTDQNQHHSGTGVEDVVPPTKLDGFIDPCESARISYESTDARHGYLHNDAANEHDYTGSTGIKVSRGSLIDDDDSPADTPEESPIISICGYLSPSFADLTLLREEISAKTSHTPQEEVAEDEEVVNLDLQESSLEKLARMVGT